MDWFLGEIRWVPFAFAPKYWALCNGQSLPIAQNQALFSLIGTYYGGDGQTTFRLPDLRTRAIVGTGTAPGGSTPRQLGEAGGEPEHTLTVGELPVHSHTARAATAATAATPAGGVWATPGGLAFGTGPAAPLGGSAIGAAGTGLPHENRPPSLVLTAIIALQGVFPPRS